MNILFWSGGKDAYLALKFFRDENPGAGVKLLTTYEENAERVPHQNIGMSHIRNQSEELGLKLLSVPLPKECPNDEYLERVGQKLSEAEGAIEYLVFGDWKLEDVREWREKKFGELGYSCRFPIWKKDLHELLPVLWLNPVRVEITGVRDEYKDLIGVGESYDQNFVTQIQRLKDDIDPMGENGEFHTKVIFEDLDENVELKMQPPEIRP